MSNSLSDLTRWERKKVFTFQHIHDWDLLRKGVGVENQQQNSDYQLSQDAITTLLDLAKQLQERYDTLNSILTHYTQEVLTTFNNDFSAYASARDDQKEMREYKISLTRRQMRRWVDLQLQPAYNSLLQTARGIVAALMKHEQAINRVQIITLLADNYLAAVVLLRQSYSEIYMQDHALLGRVRDSNEASLRGLGMLANEYARIAKNN